MSPASGAVGVCLATTAAQPGGVWRHICDLADAYAERGIAVRIDLPAHAERLRDDASHRGYSLRPERFAHEVFHAHLGNTYDRTMTVALAQARAAGARVVITEHLPRSDASDARLADRAPRFGARAAKTAFKQTQLALADRVIAVSSGSAAFLEQRYGLVAPKLVTVFNGVRVDPAPAPVPSVPPGGPVLGGDGPRFAATGAVIAQKGFDLLVEAGRLAEQDWRVDVYGTGPHLGLLQAAAADLRSSDGTPRLVFHGWTDDVRARVSAADALVMPSRWEAMPYSALEAMSWSRPVIGTAVDGLTDVVVPGSTGFLVPPDPGALAAGLDTFPLDRSPAMGRAGRDRVASEFALDTMVRGTLEVYQQCLGRVGVELVA